jgi:DNA-binding CsgD family transcriptional regulator
MALNLQIRYSVSAADIWGPRVHIAAGNTLTDIELRVLQHAAMGLSDKQIANVMGRATKTVRYHLRMVRLKFNMSSRFQLGVGVSPLLLTRERNYG